MAVMRVEHGFHGRVIIEDEEIRLEICQSFSLQLYSLCPPQQKSGVFDATARFRSKIEDLMNNSILNGNDLGRGRDADGRRFNGFKVTKVSIIIQDDEDAREYVYYRGFLAEENPPPIDSVDTEADWLDKYLCPGTNEVFLFHGTDSSVAKVIAESGFDEEQASPGGMFGKGLYFTENADKAYQYTSGNIRMMFLVQVLLGNPYETTKALNGWVEPPEGYDSVIALSERKVGRKAALKRHQEFIVYKSCQCLPAFLIEYQRV